MIDPVNPPAIPLAAIPEVERLVYQAEDAYFPSADQRARTHALLRDAFSYQYRRCEAYRAYCDNVRFDARAIEHDVRAIPQVPSTIFKTTELRTASGEPTVKACVSSGTQGTVSTVARDNTTMQRFLGSVRNAVDHVLELDDALVLNLGPPADQAKDVWFSYVMSITDMLFPSLHYVGNGVLEVERFLADLRDTRGSAPRRVIVGAPALLMEVIGALRRAGTTVPGCEDVLIVTAGGWKRHQGAAISPDELRDACQAAFVGVARSAIRDAFNMVELNTILPECAHHRKHVPVWLDAFALDVDTYRPAARGQLGLLVFLDPTATSYPGFVMSGDLGRITQVDDCPCGRPGVCLEVTRRVSTIESRGCAQKLSRQLRDVQSGR